MRRGLLLSLAAVAMVLPAGAQAGGELNVTGFVGERTGTFPGTGQPLAGASVQLLASDVPVDSDTTDINGNYTVTAPVGSLEVVASKTGYVTQCRKFAANGSPVTPPPIELPTPAQAGGLSGTVRDSFTDDPIEDVTVEVSYDQGCDPAAPSQQTDSNGHYFFPALPGPEHLVTSSKPGYNSRTDATTVFAATTVLDPELEPVDSKDPKAKIKSVKVKGHRATIKFKGSDPAPSSGGLNFSCALDDGAPEGCESPQRYPDLDNGRHKVKVVAFDAAGNFDQTPAKQGFKVG